MSRRRKTKSSATEIVVDGTGTLEKSDVISDREDQRSCRIVVGSTEGSPARTLTGEMVEAKDLFDFLCSLSMSVYGVMLGREYHRPKKDDTGKIVDEGLPHYHWVINFSASQKEKQMTGFRKRIDEWSGVEEGSPSGNWVHWGNTKNPHGMVRYSVKNKDVERRGKEIIILRKGFEKYDVKYLQIAALSDSLVKDANTYRLGVKASRAVLKENELLALVKAKMKEHGLSVDRLTRRIRGRHPVTNARFDSSDSLYIFLHEELQLQDLFSSTEKRLILRWIEDRVEECLPMHDYNNRYIGFTDGMWDLKEGKRVELNSNVIPVMTCPVPMASTEEVMNHPVVLKIQEIVNAQEWKADEFRTIYGRQFQEKLPHDKSLVLCGTTGCGKSLLCVPYERVFENVLARVTQDGKFSMGAIATATKVFGDDVRINFGNLDEWKKALSGVLFDAAIKHETGGELFVPKTMLLTSQVPLAQQTCMLDVDRDAIERRTVQYLTWKPPRNPDTGLFREFRLAAPIVAMWCTMGNPLPTVKSVSEYERLMDECCD